MRSPTLRTPAACSVCTTRASQSSSVSGSAATTASSARLQLTIFCMARAREQQRRRGGRRARHRHGTAHVIEPALQRLQDGADAAEELQAAFDVEQERARRRQRDVGRELAGPRGECSERRGFGAGIARPVVELGRRARTPPTGACLGARPARAPADCRRSRRHRRRSPTVQCAPRLTQTFRAAGSGNRARSTA